MDDHKNFAIGSVMTPPSPAASGTSLVLQSGQGALMPTPPFNAVVCPTQTQPTASNAEIVRVLTMVGDTVTSMTRAQEGSTARAIIAGDQFFNGITDKILTDIEAAMPNLEAIPSTSGISFLPEDSQNSRFSLGYGNNANPDNPSRDNDVFTLGYNKTFGGDIIDTDECTMAFHLETHWAPGAQDPMFEWYMSVTPPGDDELRPIFIQIDKESGAILNWEYSPGSAGIKISDAAGGTAHIILSTEGIALKESSALLTHDVADLDWINQAGVSLIKLNAADEVVLAPDGSLVRQGNNSYVLSINRYLQSRNFADDGDINMIGLDNSNVINIATSTNVARVNGRLMLGAAVDPTVGTGRISLARGESYTTRVVSDDVNLIKLHASDNNVEIGTVDYGVKVGQLLPYSADVYSIGASGTRFANVHSYHFRLGPGQIFFGGSTSGHPALVKGSGANIRVGLGDESAGYGTFDAGAYLVGGAAGIDFSGPVTNITVVKGIVTAAS